MTKPRDYTAQQLAEVWQNSYPRNADGIIIPERERDEDGDWVLIYPRFYNPETNRFEYPWEDDFADIDEAKILEKIV